MSQKPEVDWEAATLFWDVAKIIGGGFVTGIGLIWHAAIKTDRRFQDMTRTIEQHAEQIHRLEKQFQLLATKEDVDRIERSAERTQESVNNLGVQLGARIDSLFRSPQFQRRQ